MAKIKVHNPVVELDGDEMTRIIWSFIKEQLILPYLDVELKYYDLGIENRDATADRVTVEAAEAIKRHGVGVKCATITPDEARVEEFGLEGDVPLAQRHDPQHPRRGDLPRADRDRQHPAPGARLDQADRDRPPRVRRPVPRDRHGRARRRQADARLHPRRRRSSRSSWTSTTSPAAAWRWRCTTSTTRSATSPAPRCATASTAATRCTCRPRTRSSNATTDASKTSSRRCTRASSRRDFEAAGITYEHRLIDDMVAAALKWEGGYVWACKNYDGDVQSDTVAQGFGSLGLMTSVLMTADGKTVEAEAAHGTVTRHYRLHQQGKPTSTNPIASIFAWTRGLAARGRMDGTPEVSAFARDARARLHPDGRKRQDDQGPRAARRPRSAVADDAGVPRVDRREPSKRDGIGAGKGVSTTSRRLLAPEPSEHSTTTTSRR